MSTATIQARSRCGRSLARHRGRAAVPVLLSIGLTALMTAPPATAGAVRSNPAAITINDVAAASPYPASIGVSGIPRSITDVDVTLHGVSHTFSDDLDVLLVGPSGRTVMLLSDAGGSGDYSNTTVIFDDEPDRKVPNGNLSTALRFQPSNYDTTTDVMPAPAPAPPGGGTYGTALSRFDGTSPNGTWQLFIRDDAGGDVGQVAGGWSLDITASPSNDDFADATPISTVAATVSGDTVAASLEPGEISPGGGVSVWYRWVAPGSGQVTLDLCGSSASMVAAPYTGSSVDSLAQVPRSFIACGAAGSPYRTTFDAVAGQVYRLQVSGAAANVQGSYVMQLTGPANTAPVITPVTPLTATRDRTPRVAATVTDAAGLTAGAIRVYLDGVRQRTFAYNTGTGALSFTSRRLSYGRHTVKIRAVDLHGAATTRSWTFRVRR